MKTNIKRIWNILKTKKCERTIRERAILSDWLDKWVGTAIRIIVFPVMLIVRLYKWTYYRD